MQVQFPGPASKLSCPNHGVAHPGLRPPDADKNFVNLMAKKEVIGENLFTAKCDLVRWLAGILLPNVVSRPNCGQPE